MDPSFRPSSTALFARHMTDETVDFLARWERDPGLEGILEVADEARQLNMKILTRSLFRSDLDQAAQSFEKAFIEANVILGAFFRFPFPPLRVPTPAHRRLRAAIQKMDEFISLLVEERLRSGNEPQGDLLSMLSSAVDDSGQPMGVEQLHHEVLNIILGAYDTTTNTITWALYLLARHPEVEAKFHAEVDAVLGGRVPTFEDVRSLKYTRMVVDETLRMYSPAWQTMRRAREDDEVGGYLIPAKANVYINSFMLHRHPDFWDEPQRFLPDRFTAEQVGSRPRHVYIPFGSGPRVCIGKHFALTEIVLILATIARHHRLSLPSDEPPVELDTMVTLNPKNGVRLRLQRR